jgi:hypothetical protein
MSEKPSPKLVIVDPAWSGSVGHHYDVNLQLQQVLKGAGWQVEAWADRATAELALPWIRSLLQDCGYLDPRHWSDSGGSLHLARRLADQLAMVPSPADQPVAAWVMHTGLPYHLMGMARLLNQQPAAQVLISLMFAPGETLEGEAADAVATSNSRQALAAIAEACRRQGHQLWLGLPSRQQQQLWAPLIHAANLPAGELHAAVVGAGGEAVQPPQGSPKLLLHWGDRKQAKGWLHSLTAVEQLLERGVPTQLRGHGWLFHFHCHGPLPESELQLLERAERQIPGFQLLRESVPHQEMLRRLAGCAAALLAYCPRAYAERSSGILWTYASARRAVGMSAAAVGLSGGWLEKESLALGLAWRTAENPSSAIWPEMLALAVDDCSQLMDGKDSLDYKDSIHTPLELNGGYMGMSFDDKTYREIILDRSFPQDIARRLVWPQV